MIWCVIFLLTPSVGIAASKHRHLRETSLYANFYMDVPEHAFENDVVKIGCSRNITDTDTNKLWLAFNTNLVAISSENAGPEIIDKDITVMPGSNGTHVSATVKAQCKHNAKWMCATPTRFGSTLYNNFQLRVLKKITALQLFALNDVCAAGDQKSKKVCQTCEKVVRQTGKKSIVKCQANVPAKVGGVYRFDWDITANVSDDWMITLSKSYSVDGNASNEFRHQICYPVKRVSSSVQIPVQTNVTFAVKCVLTFNVGNLSQTVMATTKLCIKNDSDIVKLGFYTAESKKRGYKKTAFLFIMLASLLGGFIIAGVLFNKCGKMAQKTEDNCSESDAQYGQNNTSEIQAELIESKESCSGSKRSLSRSKRPLSHSKRSLSHSKRTYSNPKRS